MFEFEFDGTWSSEDNWDIVVIGAGGNGSHFLKNFATLDMLNKHLDYINFNVKVYDPDTIEIHNTARQQFNPASVGFNKAVNICSKINNQFGLDYSAIPEYFQIATSEKFNFLRTIYVLAVDDPKFRLEFYKNISSKNTSVIDMGNGNNFGQIHYFWNSKSRETERFKEYKKSLYNLSRRKTKGPSCSHIESVKSQGLFVNSTIAQLAATALFNLFMYNPKKIPFVTFYDEARIRVNTISALASYERKCSSPLI